MCGRFTLTKDVARFADDLGIRYPKATATFNPRFNVCPSQPVIIISTPDDSLEFSTARWGLVPAWAKDPAIGSRLANPPDRTPSPLTSKSNFLSVQFCLLQIGNRQS